MQRTPPRKETPGLLRSAPSSTPYDTMNASQQAHIDELIQKNRTLEHMGTKLREELARSESQCQSLASKHKQQTDALQQKWAQERVEWMDGCDAVQSAHRIAHLRTTMLLDAERRSVLMERDGVRKERLGKMQRDYRIVLFQIKENELEDRLEELQEELDEVKAVAHREGQQLHASHLEVVQKWREKCIGLIARVKEKENQLQGVHTEKDAVETDVSRLREEINNLTALNASLNTNLERKSLQLDGAKIENEELERLNADLKRNNADLKRQVDKWQSLDTKEGDEMEKLRKRRVELEVHVKELESRLADLEKKADTGNQALEVANAKIEKYKVRLQEYTNALDGHEKVTEDYEEHTARLEARLVRAKEEIKKLRRETSSERKKAEPILVETSKPKKKSATPVVQESDGELSQLERPSPRPKPRPSFKGKEDLEEGGSKSKGKEAAVEGDEDSDVQEITRLSKPRSKRKTGKGSDAEKPKRGRQPKNVVESGTEAQPTMKGRKGKKVMEHDSDIGKVETAKGKGKAKVVDQDNDEETTEKPKKRGRPKMRVASESEDIEPPAKKKSGTRAPSKQPLQPLISAQDANAGVDGETKTKKRRIRIFNTSQPSTFAWNLNATDALGALEIPTELSPVKEGELVPPRSIFSKSGSTFR